MLKTKPRSAFTVPMRQLAVIFLLNIFASTNIWAQSEPREIAIDDQMVALSKNQAASAVVVYDCTIVDKSTQDENTSNQRLVTGDKVNIDLRDNVHRLHLRIYSEPIWISLSSIDPSLTVSNSRFNTGGSFFATNPEVFVECKKL